MNNAFVSALPDADMQATYKALLRAAQRAREVALQTNTPLVFIRDGVLVEEFVTDVLVADQEAPVLTRS